VEAEIRALQQKKKEIKHASGVSQIKRRGEKNRFERDLPSQDDFAGMSDDLGFNAPDMLGSGSGRDGELRLPTPEPVEWDATQFHDDLWDQDLATLGLRNELYY
jgi:hypothetical protein